MRKTEDKEKASTVEANKVKKEESLKVAGGRCWKRVWLTVLKKTGDIFHLLFMKQVDYLFSSQGQTISSFHLLFGVSSETLVLPITTLLLIVAYSVVAIYFYNMDG